MSLPANLAAQGGERPAAKGEFIAYIGTFTTTQKSKGIDACRFQPATGTLTSADLLAETANPTFLAVDPSRRFLYSVNAIANYEGQTAGSISSFSIDAKTGGLKLLNRVSSRGTGPTHLIVDKTDRCLLAANFTGGSVAAFPVKGDGSLGEASSFFQHTGSSVNPQRQAGPHAHSVNLSPDNRFVLVADLGLDQVLSYRLDPGKAALAVNDPPFVKVSPGSGPRHMAFHPNGRFAYVINEMLSTATAFAYDSARGSLKELQTISTLPKDFSGGNTAAEVAVDRTGRFLYGSNRGHDSIALFTIDPRNGTLTLVEQVSAQGKAPRYFTFDPTGTYLLAANQDSGNIVLFRVDQRTGRLTPAGRSIEVPSPVCVVFVPAR
jgi:6-phosphogluconolactonase